MAGGALAGLEGGCPPGLLFRPGGWAGGRERGPGWAPLLEGGSGRGSRGGSGRRSRSWEEGRGREGEGPGEEAPPRRAESRLSGAPYPHQPAGRDCTPKAASWIGAGGGGGGGRLSLGSETPKSGTCSPRQSVLSPCPWQRLGRLTSEL